MNGMSRSWPLRLLNDEIHVWRAFLEVPSTRLKSLHSILSDDEANQSVRYCFERDRRRFIIRRGLLRCILSRYLGQSPRALAFQCNNHGKPALASMSGAPSLCFNVSHSGELTLYAITRNREVGVDIEYVRPFEDAEDIVKHFFSSREKAEFGTLPARIKNQAFFACWTRKEAYIKARGEGLSYPLSNFSVSMIPDESAGLVEIKGDKNKKSRWTLKTILPGAGYVAAVAVEGHGLSVRHRQWSW